MPTHLLAAGLTWFLFSRKLTKNGQYLLDFLFGHKKCEHLACIAHLKSLWLYNAWWWVWWHSSFLTFCFYMTQHHFACFIDVDSSSFPRLGLNSAGMPFLSSCTLPATVKLFAYVHKANITNMKYWSIHVLHPCISMYLRNSVARNLMHWSVLVTWYLALWSCPQVPA